MFSLVVESFKPYYKWITFNTLKLGAIGLYLLCFKPYYKWITFNTLDGVTSAINLMIARF